ncbi:helix-turn-helix domain-containing protein [Pseudomonas sp. MH9.2]|uniref:helix-turn-helix domain-containing protein n=1 Tax=Pseudomonas sp. MH9.2 TaxID=3048629 RepID=UPI0039FD68A7
MESTNAFGEALRSLRLRQGLSQQDFVRVVSREHLSRLERGVSQPNLQLIRDLAGVLGIHPISLLAKAFERAGDASELRDLMVTIASDLGIDLDQ